MKVLDQLVITVQRRLRRRRRKRELADMALPGLEGYMPSERSAEAHTAARRGAGGKLARARSLRVALAAMVVSAGVGFPAYLAGTTVAGAEATEEAEQADYEEALADYQVAQERESATLQAAIASYSTEREASDETTPEEAAVEEMIERRGLSETEAAEVVAGENLAAGFETLTGPAPAEAQAIEMWSADPPRTEVTRERIEAYETASKEADRAETEYQTELQRVIDD